METAYQKWEKRRQERTGGHRPALSHRRKKGSVALGPRGTFGWRSLAERLSRCRTERDR